jgi:hypothetical protein
MSSDEPLVIPDVDGLSRADAAVAYAEAGWKVGPLWWAEDGVCGCGNAHEPKRIGKHPLSSAGVTPHGLRDWSSLAAQVAGWWRRYPKANIGLLPPRDYFALDVDDPECWKANGVDLPRSGPAQLTGSGNGHRQHVYRLNGQPRDGITFNTKLDGRGAETKGDDGGYLVVPPSVTRGEYRWVRTGPVPAVPDELYAILPRKADQPVPTVPPGGDCCAVPAVIERDPGGHEWLLKKAGHLKAAHGLHGVARRTLLLTYLPAMRPPYPAGAGEAEIDGIVAYDERNPTRIEMGGKITILGDTPGPEPAEAESSTWPDPPAAAAYHGVLGEIALAVAPFTEADPIGILGTLAAMFGVACGGARTLYQGSQQRTNLSFLLVGETGMRGRKGTGLDIGRAVFRLAYPPLADLWLVGVASGEAITGHLGRHDGQDGRPAEDRVLIVEPEFGRLLTIMNRDGSTLSPVLRNAWDGVPLGHARARDESLVSRHHVTMLGHVTPVELRAKLTEVDAANGFANRLLFLAVRRQRLIPFPTAPDEIVQPWVEPLHLAIVEARLPGEMSFDAAARDRWEDFYAELALTPRLGLSGAVTGRHEAQVARLALLYALADRSPDVGVAHLEAAIALADYARRSVIWALGDSTGNRHADVLRRMLVDGEIAWLDARRALGLRTAADMAEVVSVLVDADLAEVVAVPPPGGGRSRRIVRAKCANYAKCAGGARSTERGIAT